MINDIKIPITTYPVSSPVSESGVALSNVKPMDIAELSRLSDELAQIPSYTSQRNDGLRIVCKQFDDEFRKVLNKRGISESDWKEYGMKKVCEICEQHMLEEHPNACGCAFRRLGNEYCWEFKK